MMTTNEVQTAIASLDPALVFEVEKESLGSEVHQLQRRLYGLEATARCLQESICPDNILIIEEALITIYSEIASLADKAEMIGNRLEKLSNQ